MINFTILTFVLRLIKGYIWFSDRVTQWVGTAASWLTLALVVLILYDVIMRYLFNQSSVAIYELEWHLFALIFLLGAAFALKHDRHVRVDVLYSKFGKKGQAWVNLLGTLLLLLPFCWIIITAGWDFWANSYRLTESSADAGGLPARYLIKSAIPIGFTLVLMQALNLMCRSILVLLNQPLKPASSG